MLVTVYKVYEIRPDCRKHGKLLKRFKTKRAAESYVNMSIYRFMREGRVLVFKLT